MTWHNDKWSTLRIFGIPLSIALNRLHVTEVTDERHGQSVINCRFNDKRNTTGASIGSFASFRPGVRRLNELRADAFQSPTRNKISTAFSMPVFDSVIR